MIPTRIICLGNELVCDDGVGIRVGRILRELDLPPQLTVEFQLGVGFDLLDTMQTGQRLVLVDAMQTGADPGTVSTMEVKQVEALACAPYCCHAVGIADLLLLARKLAPEWLPTEVLVVGVEAVELFRFGTTLSEPVRAALPGAVRATLEAAGADEALIGQAVARAEELLDWEPDPADIPGA